MKKKILYLFSETGGGHRSAAAAIMRAVEHLSKDHYHQEMIDFFAECSGFLNMFARLYAPVIKNFPKLWGYLYYWMDDVRKLDILERIGRSVVVKDFTRLICEKKPSIIVSVHPLVNHLTVKAIKQSGMKIPFMVAVTDPVTFHRAWITPEVDLCVVATREAKQLAIKYGMPEKKVKVIGMPIDPKFFLKDKEKQEARRRNELKPKLFTILLMGGGEGAGKIFEIVEELSRQKIKAQLVVIAGRNKNLEERIKKDLDQYKVPVKVYGFTDRVHEIMSESDLIITKAGPGTIFEALTMNLPIIITSWLPGQEEGNVEYVVRENVGRVSRSHERVVEIVKELMETDEFDKMKRNIMRVSRPQAALDIAREIFHCI
jgi:1,2-diacylglycerol 3-beta-galactosyltransferase